MGKYTMIELEKIRLWEHLKKDFISKIKDEKTRKLYYKTLLIKAIQEFGFNPEKCIIPKNNEIQLDDWEKEFVKDIKKAQIYEIDTRIEKRKKTEKEAEARMKDFILKDGDLKDIPEEIRTDTIEKLYYDCFFKLCDETLQEVDNFLKK